MISVIQGALGSGKSCVSLLQGIRHLEYGGVLATNFNLVEDWAERLASQNIYVRLGLWNYKDVAESYYKRCFKVGKAESLYKLAEKIPTLSKGWASKQREGQCLLIMDEAHMYFNSREWAKNKEFIKFFSQSRKLKYDVLLVSHSIDAIDKQIRMFVEIEEKFRNTKKLRIPYTPIPLTPCTGFLVGRYYYGVGLGTGMRHSVSFYRFIKAYADLYDSWELFDYDSLIDDYVPHGKLSWKKTRKKITHQLPAPGQVLEHYS